MANQQNSYTGSQGTGTNNADFSFTFPSFTTSEVKVEVDNVVKTLTTHYTVENYNTTSGGKVRFTAGNIPTGTTPVRIFRQTDVDSAKATFTAGSSLKAAEINDNFKQVRHALQEAIGSATTDRKVQRFNIEADSIDETLIADDAVTGAKIADNSIGTEHLKTDSVQTIDIKDANVTTQKLAAFAVTDSKIGANQVITSKIADGNVTTDKIANDAVTNAKIADSSVNTAQIVNDAINGTKIADDSINSEHYVDGSIDTAHIANSQVTTAKIADSNITTAKLASSAVTSPKIADNAVTSTEILNGAVTEAKLATAAATTNKIANYAVTTAKIANSAVTGTQLAADAVTGAKIADNAIDSEHYTDGSIDTAHIADSNVTTAKIADSNVTTAKIANDAVNGTKIADNSINSEHYVDGSIDHVHLANDVIDGDNIQDDVVNSEHIAAGALDNEHYAAGSITADKLNGATVVTNSEQSGYSVNDTSFFTTSAAEARYFNASTGETIKDGQAFPDNDTTIATTAAINDRIIDLVDDVGGFVPIANETSFPNANPDVNNGTGTIVSISTLASNHTSNGSGTFTISNGTVGNSTVTITGAANNTTYSAGYGLLVETTTTLNTYTFHRLVPKATEITTVAGKATEIGRLGTAAAVADMAILGTADVVSDLNTLGTADVVADMNMLAVSDVISDMNTLAVTSVLNNIDTVATNVSNVNTTAGSISNVNTAAGSISNINTVAGINANVTTVAGISSNVTSVANNSSNINSAVSNASNINSAVSNASNINTVAGSISNVNTTAGSISNVNSVASNMANVNNFADRYQIAANNPSTDGGGNALAAGDLYFNTSANELKVYNGSAWQAGVTATGNFAVTTGNTFTGNNIFTAHTTHNDNVKALFGTGNDLETFSDGTNGVIRQNSGDLYIQGDSFIQIGKVNAGAPIYGKFINSGAVELYYDNVKKLETSSEGVQSSGHIRIIDDKELKVGSGNDLRLFHLSNHSYIDNYTGDLRLRGGNIHLTNTDDEKYITGTANGAVELYYDNSKKLETNSLGVEVFGDFSITMANGYDIWVDNSHNKLKLGDSIQLQCGNSGDLAIFHNGSDSIIRHGNATTGNDLYIQSDTKTIFGSVGGAETHAVLNDDGSVELYHNNSKTLETTANGVNIEAGSPNLQVLANTDGENAKLTLIGRTSAGGIGTAAICRIEAESKQSSNSASEMQFKTRTTGNVVTTALTIDESQHINLPIDGQRLKLGASADLEIYHNGTNSLIDNNTGDLYINSAGGIFIAPNNNEAGVYVRANGSVELYHDNVKKLHTTSDGVYVSGEIYSNVQGTSAAIALTDNGRIAFGSGADLQIYHDGSHSYIRDTGTGNLRLGAQELRIQTDDFNENYIIANKNGQVSLYYDNSEKLRTVSGGVNIYGGCYPNELKISDNENIKVGTGDDITIHHDATNSHIRNNTGTLNIRSDNLRLTDATIGHIYLVATSGDSVSLYHDNNKRLETASWGASLTGTFVASGNIKTASDTGKLMVGAGDDLEIYHDGTNSRIHSASHNLYLRSGGDFGVFNGDGSETMLLATPNSGVKLYYNNVLKAESTNSGLRVHGHIDIEDNDKLRVGTGDDLQIFHDGTNTMIDNDYGELKISTPGVLRLRGGNVSIQNENQTETMAFFSVNSNAKLYFDNVEKLETTSEGIESQGELHFKSPSLTTGEQTGRIEWWNENDAGVMAKISIDRTASTYAPADILFSTSANVDSSANGSDGDITERMRITSAGNVGINQTNPNKAKLHVVGDNTDGDIIAKFKSGAGVANDKAYIALVAGYSDTANDTEGHAYIGVQRAGSGNNSRLLFGTYGGGSEVTTKMTISEGGNVGVGKISTSLDSDGAVFSDSGQHLQIVKSGSGGKALTINRRTNVGISIEFYRGSSVGSISHNNSSTTYNTSSDYRLKENVVTLDNAITRLKTLKPYRFNFKVDKDTTVDGFIAHEVTATVPEAVTGIKDAVITQAMVDAEEYEEDRLGEIIPQGIDHSKLVPLLTASLQEAIAKIEVLEAKVAALEAA